MKLLNFNVQIPTILEVLEFYASQGIIYSTDKFDNYGIDEIFYNKDNNIVKPNIKDKLDDIINGNCFDKLVLNPSQDCKEN